MGVVAWLHSFSNGDLVGEERPTLYTGRFIPGQMALAPTEWGPRASLSDEKKKANFTLNETQCPNPRPPSRNQSLHPLLYRGCLRLLHIKGTRIGRESLKLYVFYGGFPA
jgi:hypothetical protein